MPKIAAFGQRGRNGRGVKVFWGALSANRIHLNPALIFLRHLTHGCIRQFYNKIESLKRHSDNSKRYGPPKTPNFRVFRAFAKVWH